MTDPLPLAAAQARLRRPGRPRKRPPEQQATAAPRPAPTPAPASLPPPRLLDVAGAAAYLGVSVWTVRSWLDAGTLRRVRLPAVAGGELRRVLVDRGDLDALVDACVDPPADGRGRAAVERPR